MFDGDLDGVPCGPLGYTPIDAVEGMAARMREFHANTRHGSVMILTIGRERCESYWKAMEAAAQLLRRAHVGERAEVFWMVEHAPPDLGGRPHWLRWQDGPPTWTTNVHEANHYPAPFMAARDARYLRGECPQKPDVVTDCTVTEHSWMRAAPVRGSEEVETAFMYRERMVVDGGPAEDFGEWMLCFEKPPERDVWSGASDISTEREIVPLAALRTHRGVECLTGEET